MASNVTCVITFVGVQGHGTIEVPAPPTMTVAALVKRALADELLASTVAPGTVQLRLVRHVGRKPTAVEEAAAAAEQQPLDPRDSLADALADAGVTANKVFLRASILEPGARAAECGECVPRRPRVPVVCARAAEGVLVCLALSRQRVGPSGVA